MSQVKADLGDVAMVGGRLAMVLSINEGNRAVTFEFVGSSPCPMCGKPDRVTINERTPNWAHDVRAPGTCGSVQ